MLKSDVVSLLSQGDVSKLANRLFLVLTIYNIVQIDSAAIQIKVKAALQVKAPTLPVLSGILIDIGQSACLAVHIKF